LAEETQFAGAKHDCCVWFVGILDYTRIIVEITNAEKIKRYYCIFINAMEAISISLASRRLLLQSLDIELVLIIDELRLSNH
jgi:hypothetical protein